MKNRIELLCHRKLSAICTHQLYGAGESDRCSGVKWRSGQRERNFSGAYTAGLYYQQGRRACCELPGIYRRDLQEGAGVDCTDSAATAERVGSKGVKYEGICAVILPLKRGILAKPMVRILSRSGILPLVRGVFYIQW